MDYPKKGRYRHFKGGEYELIYIARNSENDEPMVVYKALYECGETPLNERIWVRPLSMWEEKVTRDGKTFQRFTYIGDDAPLPEKEEHAPEATRNIHEILSSVYGYSTFRPGQEDVINAILSGRHTLGVMPTGAGKSLCYQIPALALEGTAIVISPLISLMKDQVAALKQAGVNAAFINTSLTERQISLALNNMQSGMYKIVYVAPERLLTERFLRCASNIEISLVAVDEAHCISQWGQDFRPSYLDIPEFLARLPKMPALCALTATATKKVREDIIRLLKLKNPFELVTGFDRPNLYFSITRPDDKKQKLLELMKTYSDMSGIVYCATRKGVEDVCELLTKNGINATRYHAGLDESERKANQEAFSLDEIPVIVATNAFGMGIDKSNVRFVIHYNMPKDIESYYQEAGRAGRDGARADCVLMYSPSDVVTQGFFIDKLGEESELSPDQIKSLRNAARQRPVQMKAYAISGKCLRNSLLEYFGEKPALPCGRCGACDGLYARTDVTEYAQKALECLRSLRYPVGQVILTRILKGSKSEEILSKNYQRLPLYGALSDVERSAIRETIDAMLDAEVLARTDGEYPVLVPGTQSERLALGQKSIFVNREVKTVTPPKNERVRISMGGAEAGLFFLLREKRKELADKARVPAFMIFSDATLTDMARLRPHTKQEFIKVSGVGDEKCRRYCDIFTEVIKAWEAKQK